MPEIPETLTRSYCPEHGDVTGATFWASEPRMPWTADGPAKREWCRCGRAVQRVTFRIETERDRHLKRMIEAEIEEARTATSRPRHWRPVDVPPERLR